MKHFYPDGSDLLQDDNVCIQRARGVAEWFDEYENSENRMLWPSQSPDFKQINFGLLDSTLTTMKIHLNKDYLLNEWRFIPPVEFHRCL